MVVKPGSVLISLMTISPVGTRQQEVDARQAGAVDGSKRGDRQAPDLGRGRRRQIGGDDAFAIRRPGISPRSRRTRATGMTSPGDRRLGGVVAEHPAFDLARVGTGRLDHDLAIELSRRDRSRVRRPDAILGLGDADARSEVGRLDEHREAERRARGSRRMSSLRRSHSCRSTSRQSHDRQSVRREDDLHQRLVHAERRRGDAGADVRHVGELEQSLNGAVLAVRAVQDGEDRRRRAGR